MKKAFLILVGLLALLALAFYLGSGFLSVQVQYILIFAVIGVGGWALLKLIQKHY